MVVDREVKGKEAAVLKEAADERGHG